MARFMRHVADVVKFLWRGDTGLRESIQRMDAETARLRARNIVQEAQLEQRTLEDLRRTVAEMKRFEDNLEETEEAARNMADSLFSQAENCLKSEYLLAEESLGLIQSKFKEQDVQLSTNE